MGLKTYKKREKKPVINFANESSSLIKVQLQMWSHK